MGMYTWLSESEFKRYSQVEDEDINEVLQQVREIDNRWFIAERTFLKEKLFRKPIEYKHYSVYERQGDRDDEVRCQTSCSTKEQVLNFLYGLNIGLHYKQGLFGIKLDK